MRVGVIGGGLAGTLLAWQLRRLSPASQIDLVIGGPTADATAASGGGVRAYEPDRLARAYAVESLAELIGSTTLRAWSGFRRIGSTYLRPLWPDAERDVGALPFAARLADASELKGFGWAGLASDVVGVIETEAGHIAPDAFRRALLTELSGDDRVQIVEVPATPLHGFESAAPTCRVGGESRVYDRVVIAAGAWTPAMLARGGVPRDACGDVKAIQYALHPAEGQLPTFFVDEGTGLYGRPVNAHTMLLGVPVAQYGGPADGGAIDPARATRAAELATERLPHMRLAAPVTVVRSADCYRAPFTLTLRPVDGWPGILTFTGGSGGSAKTALAASRHAAAQLIADSVTPRPPTHACTPDAFVDLPQHALREG